MMRCNNCRWLGAVAVACGLWATVGAAQPPRPATPAPAQPGQPDLTELAKAKQRVAEQKAESEVAEAIKAAEQMAPINRAKAAEILKGAKANVQFAQIGEAARTRLTNALDAKLAAVEGKGAAPANPGGGGLKLDPKAAEVQAAQKQAAEKINGEFKDVVAGLKTIQKAQDAGKTAEANAEIARLTKLYPNNPSVQALGQNESMQSRLSEANALVYEARDRWRKVQIGIDKSALPAIYDMEFPPDWKEKSERRLKALAQPVTAKEKRIIEALDRAIDVNFRERPFEEALQDLSNKLDLPLLLDRKSVADLELDLKRGATLEAKGLSGRTVLRSLLATQGLTFVVKDETVQIVTVERARTMLTTRVYYIGDLIRGVGPFGGLEWGPVLNAQQTAENAAAIVKIIRDGIDPLSWDGPARGAGSVAFNYATMSITVRASAEVHYALSKSFGR
ncbi:MAG: hypothetical protein K2V38_26540 [Gemmataceae bacterium]|nr:hypothetical protein [Gemmataceae bacterium]